MGDTQEPTAGGSRGVVVVVIVVVAVAHCTAPPTRPARSLDVYARLGPGIGSRVGHRARAARLTGVARLTQIGSRASGTCPANGRAGRPQNRSERSISRVR
jgi:hypothetical protein